jgi:integrase
VFSEDSSTRSAVGALVVGRAAVAERRVAPPAPVHPHLFRHAWVRQLVRQTRSLPLAQRQAGWARLQMAYLTIGDDEARELMRRVRE